MKAVVLRLNLCRTVICLLNAEAVIGLQSSYCSLEFSFNDSLECCENKNSISLGKGEFEVPLIFHALGTTNVTLQQSWITPSDEHYPLDLGLALEDPISTIDRTFFVCC